MDDISLHLRMGKFQVIDADLSKYFDTIPHDKLLGLVARRVVDKNILKLIRMWLKAPVVEEGEDGKKRYLGNDQGTPQGGVISPLLANIYLNVLDKVWKAKKSPGEDGGQADPICGRFCGFVQREYGEAVEGDPKSPWGFGSNAKRREDPGGGREARRVLTSLGSPFR